MGYVVAHCRKVQTVVGLANVAAHNSRESVYEANGAMIEPSPDWITRPDRAHLNKGDMLPPEVVLKRRGDRIRAAEASNLADGQKWRRPQKNASAGIEVAVSASPEWFEGKSTTAIRAYFDDAKEYLARRFGRENIIQAVQHWDEKTPHMHLIMVPLLSTEKGLKYSSSEFLGGRHGLRDFQTEIAEAVGKKHGLERGNEGSKARHKDQYQWADELERKAAELAELGPTLEARNAELDRREAALAKRMADFEKRSAVKVKVFEPVVPKKPAGALILEFDIGGGKRGSWEKHVIHEVTQQASAYGKAVAEVAAAAQVKAARYEADAKRLPEVGEQLSEAMTRYTKLEASFNRLSPAALRAEADRREAALEKRQERDRERGGQER